MAFRQPRYTKEEHARRGEDIGEQHVRSQVEGEHQGEIVGIDIDSGDFELAADTLTASEHLLRRQPEAQIWCVRIGHRVVHRFGPRIQPACLRPTATPTR